MGPGFNRFALVLSLLVAGAAAGCSGGGGGGGGGKGGFGSTAAPTTSATNGVITTAAVTSAGPQLASATWLDRDGDGRPSRGDHLRVSFNAEIKFKAAKIDANKEFALPVAGDSLGTGATVESDPASVVGALITLGDKANVKIGGAFLTTQVTTGLASGIDVGTSPTGMICSVKDQSIRTGSPVDVGGNAKSGFFDAPSMVTARGGHQAVTLDDGRVLVTGGMKDGAKEVFAEDAEIFDPATGQWVTVSSLSGNTKGRMLGKNGQPVVRVLHTMTKLADGKVLITGGYGIERKSLFGLGSPKKETLDDAHVFDPVSNTFSRISELNADRHSHSATLMSDGRVLIAGGYSDSLWSKKKTEAPFEIFDPKSGKFGEEKTWLIFTRDTVEKRQNHAAVAIDGSVLLAGGDHWEGGFLFFFGKNKLVMNKGSETFSKNQFKKSGALKSPRRFAPAAQLPTSKDVLLVSGNNDSALVPSIESWNQASGQWTVVGNLAEPRANAKVVTLGDEAFVIGGFRAGGDSKKVETFDGATKALGTSYELKLARNSTAVVKLNDGRILVTGGFSGGSKSILGQDGQATASCEQFVQP